MFAIFIFVFTISSLSYAENITSLSSDHEDNYCLLPSYPDHGSYTVRNHSSATPGQRYTSLKLEIFCDTGYLNNSTVKSIFCVNGEWSASMPTCVRDLLGFCTVPTGDLRVEYCLSFPGTLERSWECESLVSRRTIVRPLCRFPGYFSRKVLSDMHCRNGTWDYNPICKPAARCFYNYKDELSPASDFKVAVNKMYREYNDTRDRNTQYSDVDEIIIPSSYRGILTKYEDDIAIVVVKRPFFFHLSVRPVCLDFDNDLDSTQLAEGNSGKTVGWSHVLNNGQFSDVQNELDFSYMKNQDCNTILSTHRSYRNYLTKGKFCAKTCEGGVTRDGSGLAFLESTTQRYYLRGVSCDSLTIVDDGDIYSLLLL